MLEEILSEEEGHADTWETTLGIPSDLTLAGNTSGVCDIVI